MNTRIEDFPSSARPESRICVTGPTGFVGSALIEDLVRWQCRVTALARDNRDIPGAEMRAVGDLETAGELEETLVGADAVVHLAARAHVMNESVADPLHLYRTANVLVTRRLAEAAVRAGVRRFVYVSSIKVNGERTIDRPFTAEDEPAPEDSYGVSKLEAEQALWEIAGRTGLEVVVVRPTLVYGPGVKGNLRRLMSMIERGIPLPLGIVRNRRSLVSVYNLCDLLVRCLEHPRAAGQTFLVSDGEDLSTPDLVREIAAGLSCSARLLPVPAGLLRAAGRMSGRSAEVERLCGSLQVDISRTRETLEWEPPVPVREGIRRMVGGNRPRTGFPES